MITHLCGVKIELFGTLFKKKLRLNLSPDFKLWRKDARVMVLASWKPGPLLSSCQTLDWEPAVSPLLLFLLCSSLWSSEMRCLSPPVAFCQLLHQSCLPSATKQAVFSWPQRETEVRVKQPRDKNILNTGCLVNFSFQATMRKYSLVNIDLILPENSQYLLIK